MSAVWRLLHHVPRPGRFLRWAGPAGLLLVVGTWAGLLIVGWAFLFWPQLGDGIRAEGPGGTGFWDALHLSLATLTTVGSPDLVPEADWLRVVVPLEALVGFGLLSASISYLLLIYPALGRRRSLAYEAHLLRETDRQATPAVRESDRALERICAELTPRVVTVERDLVSFPVTYYFTEGDQRFSLAAAGPYLIETARRGAESGQSELTRARAQRLLDALDDLAGTIAAGFPRTRAETTEAVFAAFARDHEIDAAER